MYFCREDRGPVGPSGPWTKKARNSSLPHSHFVKGNFPHIKFGSFTLIPLEVTTKPR